MAAIDAVAAGADIGYVASHTLAETYAVLTRLPISPRIAPSEAWELIRENVIRHFQVVSLTPEDYGRVFESLARRGISGGQTYDALLLHAAEHVALDRLYTLNVDHFRKLTSQLADKIFLP